MQDCIFCKIASGEIPANKVYEDENYIAFEDIHPQAPIHILLIPKKHIVSFVQTSSEDREIVKGLMDVAWKLVDQMGLTGLQLHMNSGSDHGQVVNHIHLHLLAKGTIPENWGLNK